MTAKQYFQTLSILHGALTMGQVIFLMLLVYLHTSGNAQPADAMFATLLMYLVPAVALLAFSAGSFLYRTRINALKSLTSLSEKLNSYRAVMIIRLAVWEGASMFSLVAYFLTGSNLFVVISVIYVLLFIIVRPTAEKFSFELELSPEEKALLENADSVVI
jgi:hypothetical protein